MNIIAMDDWAIYAVNDTGQMMVAFSECWPEWLEFDTAPEGMADEEFKLASLRILAGREVQGVPTDWVHYKTWFVEGEKTWIKGHGRTFDEDQLLSARADAADSVLEIIQLGRKQLDLLTRLKVELTSGRVKPLLVSGVAS